MAKSATYIGGGFIGAVIGGVCAVAGTTANATEAIDGLVAPSHPGTVWVVIGLILAAAGAIAVAVGFWKLANDVDFLARGTEYLLKAEKARADQREVS
jgi:MFS superfamily sulfate permease-like transporter